MEKEFNLKEKRILNNGPYGDLQLENLYPEKDVKEFIRLLKEELGFNVRMDDEVIPVFAIKKIIDKLAGDKLK